MIRKTVQTPSVADAIKAWHEVSEKYGDFGASDTEPRAEFSILMDSVDDYLAGYGDIKPIPTTIRDWQLFSAKVLGCPGAGEAARELTKAARVAVRAAKLDGREALLRALGY